MYLYIYLYFNKSWTSFSGTSCLRIGINIYTGSDCFPSKQMKQVRNHYFNDEIFYIPLTKLQERSALYPAHSERIIQDKSILFSL